MQPLVIRPFRTVLSSREAAEAIEQFGDDLAKLNRAFDAVCGRMHSAHVDRVNEIDFQDKLDVIAEAFRALGDRLSRECDAHDVSEDERRDNPLMPDYRRLGV